MRGLNCILIVTALVASGVSCKTRRPMVEIEESVPSSSGSLKGSEPTSDTLTTLRIVRLSYPLNPKRVNRILVELRPTTTPALSAGKITRNNYDTDDKIPVVAGRTYELTVTAFTDDNIIYTSAKCTGSKEFTAKAGVNSYTVPVCEAPENFQSTNRPQTDEGEHIGSSADD